MKTKWTTALMITLFSGALAVGSAASAGGADNAMTGHENTGGSTGYGNTSKMDFNKLDQNHDGRISRAEASADPALGKHFNRFDTNMDRQLNRAEFSRFETMEQGTDNMKQDNMKQDEGAEPGQSGSW